MTLFVQSVLAVAAGVLLNLTPCVLPAIPLKVRAVLNETGTTPRRRLVAAGAFLGGTLAFFLALGGATALLHLTWGGLFQSRTFLGLLSAFLLVSGIIEFFDISIPVPQAAYRVRGRRYMEPFLSGAVTGILATPCTGFFLGGVLAYALTRPPIVTLWLFAAIGTGLALPYVLMVLRPEWLSRLPRGGEWTARSKEILGFALIGGAIFFGRILLPGSFETPLWLLWAAGLSIWAAASWARAGRWPGKAFASLCAAAGVSLVLAASAPCKDSSLPWEPYRETALASARSRGVPALIEFTAEWCINCKVLEKTVYSAPGVVRAAREAGLAAFRVDLTESDPGKVALLASFGGAGIPFAVVLSSQGEVVARLADLFTSSALEAAIRRAGAAEGNRRADAGSPAESPQREEKKDGTASRPEMAVPRGKNRLALETSPYLLKHADNPVDWYPWGEEAFAKAKSENKPIFLSIGYSTCYWCSVMERESFADESVADLMNRYVVSVKVDREERPDLDGIYMTAVLLMTGQGGWPMSVLLTPDGKPFFGATYIPKPGFMQLLDAAHAAWTQRRDEVLAQAERVAEAVAAAGEAPGEGSSSLPAPELVGSAARRFGESFDPEHGGFGGAPKFPRPSMLELLMSHFEKTGERSSMSMVERTLEAMARGGVHDQAGGGFHRYSTDAKWLVPHFEKMLYDQAQLLHAYARAYKLTGNEEFRRVSGRIATYVEREMTSPAGLFYSAQDSEVDGEEGKPYLWTREELKRALGESEYALATRVYGFSGAPNFEGRYILHRPDSHEDVARAAGSSVPDLLKKVEAIDAKLLAERRKRPQPSLDDKSIASWNGLMIEALAYAGGALKNDRYVRMASRAADNLLKTLRDDRGEFLHVARGGRAKLDAYLDDYAATILGLLELHRATGEPRWLTEADRIANAMVERLWEPGGGFRYAAPSVAFLIASPRDTFDGAFPAADSLAVRALTGLAAQGHPRYARYAEKTLAVFEPAARKAPHALPYMLWGLHEYRIAKLPEESRPVERPGLPSTAGLVRIEGRLSRSDLSPGEPVDLFVTLRIDEGWHLNANPASDPSLVPTSVDVAVENGEVTFIPRYPKGKILRIGAEEDPVSVYHGRVEIQARLVPVRLPAGDGSGRLSISVEAQACNDTGRCLAPATIRAEIPVRYGNDAGETP